MGKLVFKASIEVPWNEWPGPLASAEFDTLLPLIDSSSYCTCINEISSSLLSKKHNALIVVQQPDGFPFFIRHLTQVVFVSNSFLFVLAQPEFTLLRSRLGLSCQGRCISVNINRDLVDDTRLVKFDISQEVALLNTVNIPSSRVKKCKIKTRAGSV